ncbi:MAG: hypothetical protein KJ070_06880 [Verrucomicrobia bacterium]|nr:hypothetical protein [Verrucomicrobiota bacterium]
MKIIFGVVLPGLMLCRMGIQPLWGDEIEDAGSVIKESVTVVADTNALTREMERLRALQVEAEARAAAEARVSRFGLTNATPLTTSVFGAEEVLPERRASAEIRVLGEQAWADGGAHKVWFGANVREAAPVTLQVPTGEVLRSRILGLCYCDPESGKSALIAEPKDSVGQVSSPNRLVYEDAFDEVAADVVYAYRTDPFCSLEQDVIIRKQLPPPAEYGLSGERVQLCVWTEFFGAPDPGRVARTVQVQVPGEALRGAYSETLASETLVFGRMRIVEGQAFSLGDSSEKVPIATTWRVLEGRQFLVESTPYRALEAKLAKLPRMAALEIKREPRELETMLASRPKVPKAPGKTGYQPTIHLQQASVQPRPGVVMDYLIVNTALLNVNFGNGTLKAGYAPVGQGTNDVWNWYVAPWASSAAMTNLIRSDNSSSSVGIVVSNAPGQWGNGLCVDSMYQSYVYKDGSGHLTVTITNLPPNVYDLFVYATRASGAGAPSFELKRAGTSLWIEGTSRWGQGWQASYWDEHEQHVRFRDIAVTNQTLLIDAYPDPAGYAALSGLQIVPQGQSLTKPPPSPTRLPASSTWTLPVVTRTKWVSLPSGSARTITGTATTTHWSWSRV